VADESVIVLDTHALIWWLSDPSQLSGKARQAIKAAASRRELLASAASILEIAVLVRRGRLRLAVAFDTWLGDLQHLPELVLSPVTADIAARAGNYGDEVHGDPIDRLIVATAQIRNARLVTADAAIRALKIVRTVW
jgi:PIN domain nuclease of toxin-antitoxin system